MWFQRIMTWFKALFAAPILGDPADGGEADIILYEPLTPPLRPEITRRQLLYPRDPMRTFGLGPTENAFTFEPPHYEAPTTMPLIRITPPDLRYEAPTQPLPVASEPPAPPAAGRDSTPTSPLASEPLAASLQRLYDLPDFADPVDAPESFEQLDDVDDMTRRLLFLRRLVRQRVYNEGFPLEQTPEQYRRSIGQRPDHDDASDHPEHN